MNDIAEKIRAFLVDTFPHDDLELSDSTDLMGEWFVDSFGLVQTVMFLESEFSIELRRADVHPDNFRSVTTLLTLVEQRLSDRTPAG
jgi:acyl carrier protein